MKKDFEHQYLLINYKKVNTYLSETNTEGYSFQDVLVSFCTVVEKVFKIKLHKKNPLLIFEINNFKESGSLVAVVLKKEKNINTIKFNETIRRFQLIFPKELTEIDEQTLNDIYKVRNDLVHGYKPDSLIGSQDDLIKKIGAVWEKIANVMSKLFGKEIAKSAIPKKKYSESELEQVLESEVRELIHNPTEGNGLPISVYTRDKVSILTSGEECPRCGLFTFSKDEEDAGWYVGGIADSAFSAFSKIFRNNLYKCSKCHLELTERQYQIAKKITSRI